MRKPALIALFLAALCVPAAAQPNTMTLTSQDVAQGARIANEQVYSRCNGYNVSPELDWSGVPKAAKSLALTLFDPDADGGWWHWIVFDIPPARHSLAENTGDPFHTLVPDGVKQGTNDFNKPGYGGPCPPAGDKPHHYEFTLWALDAPSAPFGPEVTGAKILPWLKAHAIATATLTALYSR